MGRHFRTIASLTLANDGTGVIAVQKTNQAGVYAFPSIPIGQYSVNNGFKSVRNPITLDAGETADD